MQILGLCRPERPLGFMYSCRLDLGPRVVTKVPQRRCNYFTCDPTSTQVSASILAVGCGGLMLLSRLVDGIVLNCLLGPRRLSVAFKPSTSIQDFDVTFANGRLRSMPRAFATTAARFAPVRRAPRGECGSGAPHSTTAEARHVLR